MQWVSGFPYIGYRNTYDHSALTDKAFGMLEVSRVFVIVRVNERQVEWGWSGRESFYGLRRSTEDDIDLVDKSCSGEVLRCNFDAVRIDL